MPPGELVYLNLPLHPGSKLDKEPPTAPSDVQKQAAENMGYPGRRADLEAGHRQQLDLLLRGASATARRSTSVAKGTYYFDHSAGADLAAKYEVRTVDGAGNASARAAAAGPDGQAGPDRRRCPRCRRHVHRLVAARRPACRPPMPARSPRRTSRERRSRSTFEGKRVLWFSKLGADGGKAAVSVDGGPAEIVDTYSADDIWGVCVYRKEFPPPAGTRCRSRSSANTVRGPRIPRLPSTGFGSSREKVTEINVATEDNS